MHLMVYFHHKSIIYEEMLMRYLTAADCSFKLPSDINEYTRTTDFSLYEHLGSVKNPWANRIAERNPYRMLFELHSTEATDRPTRMKTVLEAEGIEVIMASSETRLSKYHSTTDSYPCSSSISTTLFKNQFQSKTAPKFSRSTKKHGKLTDCTLRRRRSKREENF